MICERERRSREEYAERTSELVAAHATADKQGLARDNHHRRGCSRYYLWELSICRKSDRRAGVSNDLDIKDKTHVCSDADVIV